MGFDPSEKKGRGGYHAANAGIKSARPATGVPRHPVPSRLRGLRSHPTLPINPAPTHDPIEAVWLRVAAGLAMVEVLTEAASTMDRARQIAADPESRLPAAVIACR